MIIVNLINIFLIAYIIRKKGVLLRSFVVINFTWIMMLLLSLLNTHKYYKVSNDVYFIINTYILFFNFTYLILTFSRLESSKKSSHRQLNEIDYKESNSIKFIILNFILFVYLFFLYKRYSDLLNIYGHTQARILRFNIGLFFKNKYESYLFSFIIGPYLTVNILKLITMRNTIEKSKKYNSLLIVLSYIFYNLIGMGRLGYFYLILFYIVYNFIIYKNFQKIKEPKVLFAFVSLLFLGSFTTLIRKGNNTLSFSIIFEEIKFLIEQTLNYFTAPIFFFNKLYQSAKLQGPFMGRIIFLGILRILPHTEKTNILIMNYNSLIQTPRMIGTNSTFNAFPTAFYNYYLDGGLAAVVFMAISTAFIVVWLLKQEASYDLLKTYILTLLIFTVFKSSLDSPDTYLTILFSYLIIYSKKNKRSNKLNKFY